MGDYHEHIYLDKDKKVWYAGSLIQQSRSEKYGTKGFVLLDIKNNWEKLNSHEIINLFNSGYSLAGEFCDGQHFTDGDNTISWFGFFKSGQTMDTIESLNLLNTIVPVS